MWLYIDYIHSCRCMDFKNYVLKYVANLHFTTSNLKSNQLIGALIHKEALIWLKCNIPGGSNSYTVVKTS